MIQRIPTPALASGTSANAVVRHGEIVSTDYIRPGTLSCVVSYSVLTLGVKARFSWELSFDGTTWVDVSGGLFSPNTYTGLSGDGVAPITGTRVMYSDWQGLTTATARFARIAATLTRTGVGPTPTSDDVTSAQYLWVPQGKV